MITVTRKKGGDNFINFTAEDKGETLGSIECESEGEKLIVKKLCGESFVLDGLIRAALNCGESEGARTADLSRVLTEELKNMGYSEEINIKSFFENKNCKNSL